MSIPQRPTLYLLAPPQHQADPACRGLTLAHPAYRVGQGPHLFRTQLPTPLTGGIMVLDHRDFDGSGKAEPFCQEVVRECAARSFQGVFFDFEDAPLPVLERAAALLIPTFQKRGWSLYLTPSYAAGLPGAKVVVSTALSGGSLRRHLREAIDAYGIQRVVLGLQWACEDFVLPARDGSGRPLTWSELNELLQKRRPSVYFSDDLCAHYFTFMPTGGSPHFILYDDAESMEKKLRMAAEMGIKEAFLPYPEAAEELTKLLGIGKKETP